MCLRINDIAVNVAESDIEVYKVACRLKGSDKLVSPYWMFPYEVGESYSSKLEVLEDYIIVDDSAYSLAVEAGIHTLANKEDAVKYIRSYTATLYDSVILRCVIPKGSEYYKGTWYYSINQQPTVAVDSYASDALKVMEIVR